jgi:hypothetical protein
MHLRVVDTDYRVGDAHPRVVDSDLEYLIQIIQ